ncbi:hypothetical protein [Roseixanthobacter glucoisosaccharinicivorans]|uniref:hypothetical protein n=1 Tax=Roseixanthobacter glucoisosaccharinicivorans TaxID=3119923 RepID=UPI003726DCCA
MATPSAAILCALVALLLWVPVGWLIARRLPLGRDLALAAAPLLGWAVQGMIALHVATAAGFTTIVLLVATLAIGGATLLLPAAKDGAAAPPRLPAWIFAAAALVAVGPALAILPKFMPDGIALASPIYDHAKIALVDEIVRTGVPPANPFLGTAHGPGSTAYYYFWLFGAAQLARLSGATGWEADIAATWFTGFASLALICGLAFRLSGARWTSALFVLVAALGGSLRPVLAALFGADAVDAALEPATGLAGSLFQTSWSPHHVAAGATVVLSLILMERLAHAPGIRPPAGRRAPHLALVLVLALMIAAGFESSLWVGGVTFLFCAGAAGLVLLRSAPAGARLAFLVVVAGAGALALALVFPLLSLQLAAASGRGGGVPVVISPLEVLGPAIPDAWRGLLDLPAYWLILLAIEFPAAWIVGAIAAFRLKDPLVPTLSAGAFASLCGGWLLVSTVGENNDLGWRAVLPGLLILTAYAGAYFARCLARRNIAAALAALVLAGLALPDGLILLRNNMVGDLSPDAARFRDAPAMWAAVRRHATPQERIASNPAMTRTLAPWPVNLSWALLADRRSCFAGNELTLAFATLPADARTRAADLFERVFAGTGSPDDLASLVRDFDCKLVLLTPQDGAWSHDPFAHSALFTPTEEAAGRWRIYRAVGPGVTSAEPAHP